MRRQAEEAAEAVGDHGAQYTPLGPLRPSVDVLREAVERHLGDDGGDPRIVGGDGDDVSAAERCPPQAIRSRSTPGSSRAFRIAARRSSSCPGIEGIWRGVPPLDPNERKSNVNAACPARANAAAAATIEGVSWVPPKPVASITHGYGPGRSGR
jgi:hypothetical protein